MTASKEKLDRTTKRGDRARDAEGFTVKERAFVLHYLGAANRNGTDAALLAGWAQGNRAGARRYACEVMARPHIVAEIQRLTEERNARLAITAEDVLRDLVILKVEAEVMPKSVQTMKLRREVLKDIGDHIAVGAFRRQVGLSSPTGGPIETADAEWLANATDEELDDLERARSIIDRRAGRSPEVPDGGSDPSGEGTPSQDA